MDSDQLLNRIMRLKEKKEKYKKQKNRYKTQVSSEQEQKGDLIIISTILGEKLTTEKNKNKNLIEQMETIKQNNHSDLNFSYKMIMKGYTVDNHCVICLNKFKDIEKMTLLTNCSHCFCTECIEQWKGDCPSCKCENNTKFKIK
jgi:hypothetical protein